MEAAVSTKQGFPFLPFPLEFKQLYLQSLLWLLSGYTQGYHVFL